MSEITRNRPTRVQKYLATGMLLVGILATGIGVYCVVKFGRPPGAGPLLPTQAASLASSIMEIRRMAFFTIAMGIATAVAGCMMLWKFRKA